MAHTLSPSELAVLTGQNNETAVLEHGAEQVSPWVVIAHGDGGNDDERTRSHAGTKKRKCTASRACRSALPSSVGGPLVGASLDGARPLTCTSATTSGARNCELTALCASVFVKWLLLCLKVKRDFCFKTATTI